MTLFWSNFQICNLQSKDVKKTPKTQVVSLPDSMNLLLIELLGRCCGTASASDWPNGVTRGGGGILDDFTLSAGVVVSYRRMQKALKATWSLLLLNYQCWDFRISSGSAAVPSDCLQRQHVVHCSFPLLPVVLLQPAYEYRFFNWHTAPRWHTNQ